MPNGQCIYPFYLIFVETVLKPHFELIVLSWFGSGYCIMVDLADLTDVVEAGN